MGTLCRAAAHKAVINCALNTAAYIEAATNLHRFIFFFLILPFCQKQSTMTHRPDQDTVPGCH